MDAESRVAQFMVGQQKDRQVLRVSLPQKLTGEEFAIVQKSVFDRIQELTGHPCLSGVIDVVLEERFQDVISVDLARG